MASVELHEILLGMYNEGWQNTGDAAVDALGMGAHHAVR